MSFDQNQKWIVGWYKCFHCTAGDVYMSGEGNCPVCGAESDDLDLQQDDNDAKPAIVLCSQSACEQTINRE